MQPTVSIILPTYNREKFLPEAFGAIAAQTFSDWELIVVDDGSTDKTRELVPWLTADFSQPVRYIHQENQGAYGARNTGLDHATGKYIAFYDSDDLWLPHHLKDCVEALESNPDVDWVYGACRMVDHATGEEIAPSTFYSNGEPRPFLSLKTRDSGKLRIIEDLKALRLMIRGGGFYAGLQNSVTRSSLFLNYRFHSETRNESEDVITVIWALVQGLAFGYIDNIHVIYRVHTSNSSAAASTASNDRLLCIHYASANRFEKIRSELPLKRCEARELDRAISRIYFWTIGYSLLWQKALPYDALREFRRGIQLWPSNLIYWKTYIICLLKLVYFGNNPPIAEERSNTQI